jgi:hypothetical protein
VNRPDIAGKTHLDRLRDDGSRLRAAEDCNGAWTQETFKSVH